VTTKDKCDAVDMNPRPAAVYCEPHVHCNIVTFCMIILSMFSENMFFFNSSLCISNYRYDQLLA
jgi:hypothetical protein